MRLTGAVIRIEAHADIGSSSSKESIRSEKVSSNIQALFEWIGFSFMTCFIQEAPKESKLPEEEEANNGEEKPVPEDTATNGEELTQSVEINGSAGGLKPSQSLSVETSSEASDTKERCVTVTGTDQQIFKVGQDAGSFSEHGCLGRVLDLPASGRELVGTHRRGRPEQPALGSH